VLGFKEWDASKAWRIEGRYFVVFTCAGGNESEPDPYASALSELARRCELPVYRADLNDEDNALFAGRYDLTSRYAVIETEHAGDTQRATPLVLASEPCERADPSVMARQWAVFVVRHANAHVAATVRVRSVWDDVWRMVERQTRPPEEVDALLDTLLALAQEVPLNRDLGILLDLLHGRLRLPGHELRFAQRPIRFERGWSAAKPNVEALGHSGLALYSLPELGRYDRALLSCVADKPGRLRGTPKTLVTVPARAALPVEDPERADTEGRRWYSPKLEYRDGVLVLEQRSASEERNRQTTARLARFAAYRIRGHLVHLSTATLDL
jgi:hypothetical protein